MVRVLASLKCRPGSNPGLDTIHVSKVALFKLLVLFFNFLKEVLIFSGYSTNYFSLSSKPK